VLLIESYAAIQGSLSSEQDVSVLSTKDLQGTADDWDKYIEVSKGGIAQFDFASGLP
jgi:hypothetical protein